MLWSEDMFRYDGDIKKTNKGVFGNHRNGHFNGRNGHYLVMAISPNRRVFG